MYLHDNTDFNLDNFDIENYHLNVLQIIQNLWSYIDDIDYDAFSINCDWFINRHKEHVYMLCILWNEEEYINLTTVLNEIRQKNTLYQPTWDERRYLNFFKKSKKKKKDKKGKKIYFYINIF